MSVRTRVGFQGWVSGDTVYFHIWLDAGANGLALETVNSWVVGAGPLSMTVSNRYAAPDGSTWTPAMIDSIAVGERRGGGGGSTTTVRFYELYVDVEYNEAPVASAVSPTGSLAVSSTPAIGWVYTDAESDVQERFQAKVFSAAQYGAGGFDPETSAATWASGEVLSAATSMVTAPLVNGAYRAYVKVADVGSGGRYGAWAYSAFTMAIDSPAIPDLTAVADPTNNRVEISVTGHDNLLTANQAAAETDSTGWEADNAVSAGPARVTTAGSFTQGAAAWAWTASGAASRIRTVGTMILPIVPGRSYTATADLKKATAGSRTGRVHVNFATSSGAFLATVSSPTQPVDGTAHTTFNFEMAVSSASTAAWAVLVLEITDSAAGEVYWADRLGLHPGVVADWTGGGFSATSRFTVERSDDGGTTWETVRSFNRATHDGPATQHLAGYDFEAARGVGLLYRASVAGSSLISSPISANTATVPITLDADGQAWLKSHLDPALNTAVCLVKDSVDSTSTEDQGVFEALGRSDPLIHGGTVRLEVFDGLEFWFLSDAEWDGFEAIRRLQVPVLLQTCFGDDGKDEWWLRLGPTRSVHRVTHDDMGVGQWRSVRIEAREVLRPEVT